MRKKLNIVGGGRLGSTLGHLWAKEQVFEIGQICNLSLNNALQAAAFVGMGNAVSNLAAMEVADVWLLAVPDDALSGCVSELVEAALIGPRTVVFHCSGALSSDILAPLALRGASCASVHPIFSFADPAAAAQAFGGTYCGAEGDGYALQVLDAAFSSIGARIVPIDARFKTIYHSAAVFASNYLVTLMDVSMQAYEKAGIPPELALKMLEPLVRGTVDNVFRVGPSDALTGPISRGDIVTAVKQYRAVKEWDDGRGQLYKQLAKLTADLARRRPPKS